MLFNPNQVSTHQRAMIADAAQQLPPKLHVIFTRRVLARLTTQATDTDVSLAVAATMRETRFKAA